MDQHLPTVRLTTAADVMTADVVSVTPETSVHAVARLLLKTRVSAVPVLDAAGTVVGIVSEGDLLGRTDEDRLRGREWWLAILSGPGQMQAAVTEAAGARQAREVMHTPVVVTEADTPVDIVAALLRTHAIKRVPVMRAGRMVGIVSRADLLRALEAPPPRHTQGGLATLFASIFAGKGSHAAQPAAAAPSATPPPAALTAASFRHLVDASIQGALDEKLAVAHAAEVARIAEVKTMLHDHFGTEMWDSLMAHARVVAAHGGTEIELLRFPCDLCSDGGRKINIADPDWAETLRGEAAELYARWLRELKPAGFGLVARVVDFPHGMPGNIALFLVWETGEWSPARTVSG